MGRLRKVLRNFFRSRSRRQVRQEVEKQPKVQDVAADDNHLHSGERSPLSEEIQNDPAHATTLKTGRESASDSDSPGSTAAPVAAVDVHIKEFDLENGEDREESPLHPNSMSRDARRDSGVCSSIGSETSSSNRASTSEFRSRLSALSTTLQDSSLRKADQTSTNTLAKCSDDECSGSNDCSQRPRSKNLDLMETYLMFTEDLDRCLNSANVRDYKISQDLDDASKIIVSGPHVSQQEDKLQTVKASKRMYNKFTLDVRTFTPEPANGLNMWINSFQAVKCMLSRNSGSPISVIELILQSENSGQVEYFGVTTAHSILTPEQQQLMVNEHRMAKIEKIWEEVKLNGEKHTMTVNGEECRSVEISGPPYPFYRHWFASEDGNAALIDTVVFKLNRDQLNDHGWFSGGFSCQHDDAMSEQGDVSEIEAIDSHIELSRLVGRKIVCNKQSGKITAPPVLRQDGGLMGMHLTFTMDGKSLVAGDCGSLVYITADETDSPERIVGMFFGTSKDNPRQHQAVILSKALKKFGPRIADQPPHDGPELIDIDGDQPLLTVGDHIQCILATKTEVDGPLGSTEALPEGGIEGIRTPPEGKWAVTSSPPETENTIEHETSHSSYTDEKLSLRDLPIPRDEQFINNPMRESLTEGLTAATLSTQCDIISAPIDIPEKIGAKIETFTSTEIRKGTEAEQELAALKEKSEKQDQKIAELQEKVDMLMKYIQNG